MARIRLIHWNADEAEERVARLQAAGHQVEWEPLDPPALRRMGADPPDAVVVDLSRIPSQGRDLGVMLRQQKSTRQIPLVFVEGAPDKVERVREVLPDAVYANWARIRSAVRGALSPRSESPVVPESGMAGYSGTPLVRKLGIKAGMVVGLAGAPKGFAEGLDGMPDEVVMKKQVRARCDLIVWFVRSRKDLEGRMERMRQRTGSGGLWIAWPKKASGVVSDLSQTVVREVGLASGMVDFKISSFDETWSGLRFAHRKRQ